MIWLLIILLLFLYVLSLYFSSFGRKYVFVFPFFHFISGFILAALLSSYIKNPFLIIMFVFSAGFLWELYEYSIDRFKFMREIYKKYFRITNTSIGLKDTIIDLALDLTGALVFILIW